MIAIVDYCKGNLKSVAQGLAHVGAEGIITDDVRCIATAEAIVLPGVGSFADAALTMKRLNQLEIINSRIKEGIPFLGICLGLHLMYEQGTEGTQSRGKDAANALGLAILPGVAQVMPRVDDSGKMYKVPHVGWNSIEFDDTIKSPLLQNVAPGEYFYFTHSYIAPDTSYTQATTTHSVTFPSVVAYREHAFGVQFHPEKSSDAGAVILQNFVNIVKGA